MINANVEYLSQVALLGYVLLGVSLYDEKLKSRLLSLLEAETNRLGQNTLNKQVDSLFLF
ncbi:MAG: hypothetical protein L0Y68_03205 [Candidatus Dadabacteria bacterium]|nr:hypothetical protein [Candidatus Dadabacteria bacterium]